jgi:transposase
MNVHKNARLTPQGRLLLVERITEQGWTVRQAAQAGGLSTSRAYHWLARLSPRRCGRAGRPQLGATALQEPHLC